MKKLIAYCGLDCGECEARTATLANDNAMREKIAKEWSALNGVEITAEMINCEGCRMDGAKTPYCLGICPIRQCAVKKERETCGDCPDFKNCHTVAMIISNNPAAADNLNNKR